MNITEKIEKKVFSFLEENSILRKDECVIVGVSGGADSMCLLSLLQAYQSRVPFSMMVVHVHHGIREQAEEDATFVEAFCRREGIAFELHRVDVRGYAAQEKCSEEDAGRRLRYAIFEEVAKRLGANRIAVAHNANDQAETLLFHLFRGSGLKGMGGILPVRGKVVRPILCLEREEIEAYLQERGIDWCIDATNDGDDYARNRIRHHILPYAQEELFPGVVGRLNKTAEMFAETEGYLEVQTKEALARCLPDGGRAISAEAFGKEHPVLQKRILLSLAQALSPTGKDIEAVHIEAMMSLFSAKRNRTIHLPFGIVAYREYDKVVLAAPGDEADSQEPSPRSQAPLPEATIEKVFLQNGEKPVEKRYTKYFDYDKINTIPVIRCRQKGDYLLLSDGRGGTIRKSLKEYMIEQKIPRREREFLPVLADGERILWLVDYRVSEYFKADGQTTHFLQVTLETKGGSETDAEEAEEKHDISY
jgi:tRNA(Ile)-lysidine synthase